MQILSYFQELDQNVIPGKSWKGNVMNEESKKDLNLRKKVKPKDSPFKKDGKRKGLKESGEKLRKIAEKVKTFDGHVERENRGLKTRHIVEQFERLARGLTDGTIETASPTSQVSTVEIKTNLFLPQIKTDSSYQANGIAGMNVMDSGPDEPSARIGSIGPVGENCNQPE